MKIVATSDLHGHLPVILPCDLLLVAGDICPINDHSHFRQMKFLAGEFAAWIDQVPASFVAVIAGNHDLIFEQDKTIAAIWRDRLRENRCPGKWSYLQDDYAVFNGVKIYGTPWQPRFCDWAFNLDEPMLARRFMEIPDDTDILICHGPPFGYGDQPGDGRTCGSPSLLTAIDRVKPKLCVFGHIHEGRGAWQRDGVQLANVTHLNRDYRPVYEPMVFDWV